jgi:hypothetical protein
MFCIKQTIFQSIFSLKILFPLNYLLIKANKSKPINISIKRFIPFTKLNTFNEICFRLFIDTKFNLIDIFDQICDQFVAVIVVTVELIDNEPQI